MRLLALLLIAGCPATGPDVDVVPPGVDTDVADSDDGPWPEDTDDAHHVLERCPDGTDGGLVATDVEAWADAILAGRNRFYGRQDWLDYEAMGEIGLGPLPIDEVRNRITRAWYRLHVGEVDAARETWSM